MREITEKILDEFYKGREPNYDELMGVMLSLLNKDQESLAAHKEEILSRSREFTAEVSFLTEVQAADSSGALRKVREQLMTLHGLSDVTVSEEFNITIKEKDDG